ncbi:RsmE family RNA methyltransferase [bacterium]|nr:RsmE family RNA methyltransferase [bacterium]
MRFVLLTQGIDGSLRVREEDIHHLKVLRLGPEFELPGLLGTQKFKVLFRLGKKGYEPVEYIHNGVVNAGPQCLFMPLLQNSRIEWCLEKTTELGVAHIRFYYSDRSGDLNTDPKRVSSRMERFRTKILAACQQSANMAIPILYEPQSLSQALEDFLLKNPGSRILGLGMEGEEVLRVPEDVRGCEGFLIGPEGDFSEMEYESLKNFPIALKRLPGNLILRSETAAIALLSLNLGVNCCLV